MLKEFKDNQKTLISFCVQVPTAAPRSESIFKNSRLMLHEIVDGPEEEHKGDYDNLISKDLLLKPGQRLEVVKITRCKMR